MTSGGTFNELTLGRKNITDYLHSCKNPIFEKTLGHFDKKKNLRFVDSLYLVHKNTEKDFQCCISYINKFRIFCLQHTQKLGQKHVCHYATFLYLHLLIVSELRIASGIFAHCCSIKDCSWWSLWSPLSDSPLHDALCIFNKKRIQTDNQCSRTLTLAF